MAKVYVKMKWAKDDDKWHMKSLDGFHLQEFYNCKFVNHIFENLDKQQQKKYIVNVEELI